jgi:predicted ArsR family transcriptional regulator
MEETESTVQDDAVEEALKVRGPMTSVELADHLGWTQTQVQDAVCRLYEQDRIDFRTPSDSVVATWRVRRHRGRPRPTENIERDNMIEGILKAQGAMTRNALADQVGLSYSLTYLALDRLRKQGRVRRCLQDKGLTVWTTEVEAPCP